jgi:hypothetical protein
MEMLVVASIPFISFTGLAVPDYSTAHHPCRSARRVESGSRRESEPFITS